jgi:pSer/pThr/pTyr-binding forkhead associated (FHA) protein
MDISLERLDETIQRQVFVETEDFTTGEPEYIIGRAQDCDLQVASRFVSRHHCELIVDRRAHIVRVRDLGSQNGTYVNEGPVINDRELHDGDKLIVGCIPFEIHIR